MSLSARLQQIGSKLGLVRLVPDSGPGAPARIATRTVTLAELTSEIRTTEVRALASTPNVLSDLPAVDAAAGITAPAHGWTAERLAKALRSPPLAGVERGAAQVEVLNTLARAGVRVEDVVRDAVARDSAADSFAIEAQRRLAAQRAARRKRLAEIAAIRTRMEAEARELEAADRRESEAWQIWWQAKADRERDLAAALALLTDASAISIDPIAPSLDPAASPKGPSHG